MFEQRLRQFPTVVEKSRLGEEVKNALTSEDTEGGSYSIDHL
jgi:hypothetical protein